jgi:hypothetical protein
MSVVVDEAALLVAPDAMLFLDRAPGPEGELAQRVQDAMVDQARTSGSVRYPRPLPSRDIEAPPLAPAT